MNADENDRNKQDEQLHAAHEASPRPSQVRAGAAAWLVWLGSEWQVQVDYILALRSADDRGVELPVRVDVR